MSRSTIPGTAGIRIQQDYSPRVHAASINEYTGYSKKVISVDHPFNRVMLPGKIAWTNTYGCFTEDFTIYYI